MRSKASFRYFLTSLGALIIALSGILLLLAFFVTGLAGLSSVVFFNPTSLVIVGVPLVLVIVAIMLIILAIVIYNGRHPKKSSENVLKGVIIVLLVIIILSLNGGFIVPVISGKGDIILAIAPIMWIILAVAIYDTGRTKKSRGREVNGVIILLLAL